MIRKRLFEVVEPGQSGDQASYAFDLFILVLIFLNVFAAIIGTIPEIEDNYGNLFYTFEVLSVAIFSVEYVLRVWTCVESDKFKKPVSGRIRYFFTPMALIDMLAILPFYLVLLGIDTRVLRVLRLFRLLRIAKAVRYIKAMHMIKNVFSSRKEELIISMLLIIMILVMSSSVMYYMENEAQPEAFSSIPASMWWAVATLTTVGYGDIYPVTTIGRVMGAIIAISGVGLFALPAGILASGFMDEIESQKELSAPKAKFCKHCGGALDD